MPCQQGTGVGGDHDSDTDMIIDESQLSIGGMADGASSDQAASPGNQGAGRKEAMQVGNSEEVVRARNVYFVFVWNISF